MAEKPKSLALELSALFNPEPSEPHYYEAVGRLITEYAAAESAAHVLARAYSGLADDLARILFGGMRFPDLRERLVKLVEKKGSEFARKEVAALVQQLSLISKERDKIAHRSTSYAEDVGLVITNAWIAKSKDLAERHIFSMDELRAMKWDCTAIFLRLMIMSRIQDETKYAKEHPQLYEPWRYTPREQANKNQKKSAAPRSRRRPRESSPK